MKAEWTNKDSLSIESTGQKAVLVIDMPTDCIKCPLADGYCWNTFPSKGKADGCPLKPLPQEREFSKQNILPINVDGNSFVLGWNACIDEILGETE